MSDYKEAYLKQRITSIELEMQLINMRGQQLQQEYNSVKSELDQIESDKPQDDN